MYEHWALVRIGVSELGRLIHMSIHLVLVYSLNVHMEILMMLVIDIKTNHSFFVSVSDRIVIST